MMMMLLLVDLIDWMIDWMMTNVDDFSLSFAYDTVHTIQDEFIAVFCNTGRNYLH